MFFYQVDVVSH